MKLRSTAIALGVGAATAAGLSLIPLGQSFLFASTNFLMTSSPAIPITQESKRSADSYRERGIEKLNSGDSKNALVDFNKAIELNPKDATAYFFRALTIARLGGDRKQQISDYSKAIQINPNYASAYFRRGTLKSLSEDHNGAISDQTKAIGINKKYSRAYEFRAYSKEALGDIKGAIQDYSKLLVLRPGNYSIISFRRANLRLRINDYRGALEDYNNAIEGASTPFMLNRFPLQLAKKYLFRAYTKDKLGNIKGRDSDLKRAADLGLVDAIDLTKTYRENQIQDACFALKIGEELGYESAAELLKEYCE